MPKLYTGQNVLTAAEGRLASLFEAGHRVVVSFSAGKDSGVCLELTLRVAGRYGALPVSVVMRDEEVMFPGTFEYADRVAQRPDVDFHWVVANQPIVNAFNREQPYWWTFDPLLAPADWVREPPPYAQVIKELNIQALVTPAKFPSAAGGDTICVLGLRVRESMNRRMGLYSSKGFLTGTTWAGIKLARPIYDWEDGDVWKAHHDFGWDYNTAYDVMHRMGYDRDRLRIAPPTMNALGAESLKMASQAWPGWFERVCARLPGVRAGAMFGKQAVIPHRRAGETWEQCFRRTCIDEAPAWIADRARVVVDRALALHASHAPGAEYPQKTMCPRCGMLGAWKRLAYAMYMGDCFSQKQSWLPEVEPEQFRAGSGTWGGGKPTW